jgi:hypothetical protein
MIFFLQASVNHSSVMVWIYVTVLFCSVLFLHRLLLELLELLFDKFNAVATAHSVVLGYLQDSVGTQLTQQEEIKLYDMADVWVKIQDVLQVRPLYRGCHLDWDNSVEK